MRPPQQSSINCHRVMTTVDGEVLQSEIKIGGDRMFTGLPTAQLNRCHEPMDRSNESWCARNWKLWRSPVKEPHTTTCQTRI